VITKKAQVAKANQADYPKGESATFHAEPALACLPSTLVRFVTVRFVTVRWSRFRSITFALAGYLETSKSAHLRCNGAVGAALTIPNGLLVKWFSAE